MGRGSRRTLDELAKRGFRMAERRHSSVGREQLICNCLTSFCAVFRGLAQRVFQSEPEAN